MAYCSGTDVNAFLGNTLTVEQIVQASALSQAATTYVNQTTNRSWDVAAVVGEHHVATGGSRPDAWLWSMGWWGNEDLHLAQPYTSVTSVTVRVSGVSTPLSFDEIDPATGWIRVRGGWYGRDLYVSYVPVTVVPVDIRLAATILVASWMRPGLHPEREGIAQLGIGSRELELRFVAEAGVPEAVKVILANYRLPVFA